MKTHRQICLAASALAGSLALAAAPAQAQDEDVIIVTAPDYVPLGSEEANKAGMALIETPQSVSLISRDQIDLLDWNNLSQTVRYVAGVTGENYGPDMRVDWLTMRGFEPVQFVDGTRASIGSIANTGLDLYGAESVQLLRGPSAALYGLTPPGGIVNITSRRPSQAFGGELGVEVGSFGHYQFNGDVTGAIGDQVSARLTGLYRESGTQTRGVDTDRLFVAPAVTWQASPATTLTVLAYYQDDSILGDGMGFFPSQGTLTENPNGAIPLETNLGETSYNRFEREHFGIGYEFEHDFGNGLVLTQNTKFTDLNSIQRGIGGNGFVDADFNGTPDDYRTVSRYSFSFDEDVDTLSVDTRLAYTATTGAIEHDLVVGLDWREYDYLGASAFSFAGIPTIDIFDPVYGHAIADLPTNPFDQTLQTQTGLYAVDQARLGNWIATLALRHDWVESEERLSSVTTEDDDTSYTLGLSYAFQTGLVPYVSVSRSFQPTAGVDRQGAVFEPTTGEQWEAGVKFQPQLDGNARIYATAAIYRLTQQNVLTADPANVGFESFQVQTGEVEVEGLEVEFVGRFDERLSLNAALNWTQSEVTASNGPDLGAELPVTPGFQASALVDYTLQDGRFAGLGASLGARFMSDSAGNLPSTWTPEVYTNPSVLLLDGSVHFDRDDLRLAISASNLTDETYIARCYSAANCFYGTPRVIRASVTRRF
jgi:iron complex outermembrane recepter protein